MTSSSLRRPEPLLGSLTVADAMHRGIVTLSPSAGIRDVASAMAECRIHAVVIIDEGPPGADDDRLWGVVSDIDLMRGIAATVTLDAGNLAALDVLEIGPEAPLAEAARIMAEHEVSHLVVVVAGRPTGVLSTLDIARAAAGGDAHGR
jgi:CBS domain-containing protein